MNSSSEPTPAVVLISGRGSNLDAIVRAAIPGLDIRAVISNRPDAGGLALARDHGLHVEVVDASGFATREAFDAALDRTVDVFSPRLVVLAGFMRILAADFVLKHAGRMLNIHPSLLPAFTGLATHRRAIEAGVRLHGATVHFVTPELDAGPIVIQSAVPVLPDDDEATLAARVLVQEHRIYPQAVRWFVAGRLSLRDGRACLNGATVPKGGFICPQPE